MRGLPLALLRRSDCHAVNSSRDYTCCISCPDPTVCSRLLEDKWRSAWSASFRYGPAQPSIIYRSLRQLEPSLSSPALHLPQTACQAHAKSWVADLFDRMFSTLNQSRHASRGRIATRLICEISADPAFIQYCLTVQDVPLRSTTLALLSKAQR